MTVEIDALVRLGAQVDGLTSEVRAMRDERKRLPPYWLIDAPALSLAALPALNSTFGPNTGFVWAVQRITIGPFGATGDLVTVYKGQSAAAVQPQNSRFSFTNQVAGSFATIHLGSSGLILMPDESIIVAGTITGTNPMLNWDVIQMASRDLPAFLK